MARAQLNLLLAPETLARLNKAAGRVALATGEAPSRQALVRELIERGLDELDRLLDEKGTATSQE